VSKGQEFLQEAILHPGALKAALEKDSISMSWGDKTTETLII